MDRRIPTTIMIGLVASAIAVSFWTIEQLTGLLIFEIFTIPVKIVVLLAPFFCLSDLSKLLYRRPKLALHLGITLIIVTLGTMLLCLPWRSAFATHFASDWYRWYHEGTRVRSVAFIEWQKEWEHYIPHMIETGIVLVYYTTIITACCVWKLCRIGGAIVAFVGYLLLYFIPVLTGLIVWDFDTFLEGIAFDNISMDLFPVLWWYALDTSIFLYMFMLIFFGVIVRFFNISPQNAN
jgi:hypothetical protein